MGVVLFFGGESISSLINSYAAIPTERATQEQALAIIKNYTEGAAAP